MSRPADRLERSPHLAIAERNAQFPPQHPGRPGAGPDLAAKLPSLGTMSQKIGHRPWLLRSQSGRTTVLHLAMQCCRATSARRRQPLAHRSFRHSKRDCNIPLPPGELFQVQRMQASPFLSRRIVTLSLGRTSRVVIHPVLDSKKKTVFRFSKMSKRDKISGEDLAGAVLALESLLV